MNIVWTQNAMADLTQLVENNQRKILLKIIKLINDIQQKHRAIKPSCKLISGILYAKP